MEKENNLKAIDLHNKVTGEELVRLLKMRLAAYEFILDRRLVVQREISPNCVF